jgi:hypothetical protein
MGVSAATGSHVCLILLQCGRSISLGHAFCDSNDCLASLVVVVTLAADHLQARLPQAGPLALALREAHPR